MASVGLLMWRSFLTALNDSKSATGRMLRCLEIKEDQPQVRRMKLSLFVKLSSEEGIKKKGGGIKINTWPSSCPDDSVTP